MKKIKNFFPYSKQNIDQNDINSVVSVLKSNFITQGPKIDEFEKEVKEYHLDAVLVFSSVPILFCHFLKLP